MNTRTLTATFPDGTTLKRRTARTYTHVVSSEGRINPRNCSWCGRPDLVQARLKDFINPVVGVVTNDPWNYEITSTAVAITDHTIPKNK